MNNKELLEWLKSASIAIVIIIILQQVFWPMRTDGRSMENTLHNNQFFIVSRLASSLKSLTIGDIIVLKVNDNGKKERIVKRVIGLEGDHIVIKDGNVYRNGELIVEKYKKGVTSGDIDLIVGKKHVYVLGDNREISKDSRQLGPISLKFLRGKVIIKDATFNIFK